MSAENVTREEYDRRKDFVNKTIEEVLRLLVNIDARVKVLEDAETARQARPKIEVVQ